MLPLAVGPASILAPTNWWLRSEAAKAALRALVNSGAAKVDTGTMQDELEGHDLAFIPADRSDSCHQAGPAAAPRAGGGPRPPAKGLPFCYRRPPPPRLGVEL